jgi:hypothetical protein
VGSRYLHDVTDHDPVDWILKATECAPAFSSNSSVPAYLPIVFTSRPFDDPYESSDSTTKFSPPELVILAIAAAFSGILNSMTLSPLPVNGCVPTVDAAGWAEGGPTLADGAALGTLGPVVGREAGGAARPSRRPPVVGDPWNERPSLM